MIHYDLCSHPEIYILNRLAHDSANFINREELQPPQRLNKTEERIIQVPPLNMSQKKTRCCLFLTANNRFIWKQ